MSNPFSSPGRSSGTDALMMALAVIIAALLAGGTVAVAVVGSDTPSRVATRPGLAGATTTTEPNTSAPVTTPSTTTAPTIPPTTPPSSVAPVSPLSVPPVTAPPVTEQPLTVSPSDVAAIVNPAVVDIDAGLAYQNAAAAGTGMILTSSGIVVTNNHVIDGATTLGAVAVGTGKVYSARVLGVDPTEDVAVLQLVGASGLPTIRVATTTVRPGQPVVAIGNALGAGGEPSVTSGSVVALNQSILARDLGAGTSEQLTGLIESNVILQPGDSGGPLANRLGEVVGMDTAASEADVSTVSESFSIPIARVVAIANQIEAGQASSTVHLGVPPFIGVQVASGAGAGGRVGALVTAVVAGGPAAGVHVGAGDLLTAINGQAIDSPESLASVLRQFSPGTTIALTWIDPTGASHNASVTLAAGPAD
jgi:S1-C subfamily serine protease